MRHVKILAALIAALLLAGCAAPPADGGDKELNTADFFAMDTYMELKACGASDDLMEKAEEAVCGLESRLSTTRDDSEVSLVNANGGGQVSEDTLFILRRALEICGETEGRLDISVYPVVRAWGFTAESYRVPEASEIESLLKNVDYEKIVLDGNVVGLPKGMEIDLGAVAKGYTVDMLRGIFAEAGIDNALFNLGGNVLAL
ncbi:MAG: FAD:protein FMN transferase, partial [Oscillospiraceae bacterium]|nr:FAD:protein FMN transferase [Oscillospiraceae bacterium]